MQMERIGRLTADGWSRGAGLFGREAEWLLASLRNQSVANPIGRLGAYVSDSLKGLFDVNARMHPHPHTHTHIG